mgnify:CR=1 FL=1
MIVSNEDYKPTESKYKGGAREMYVTYDLEQKTRVIIQRFILRLNGFTSQARLMIGR